MIVQLILQVGLPVFLLTDIFRRKYRTRLDWLVDLVMVASVFLFIFLTSRWDWFSYYLRVLLVPAFGLVAYASFRCIEAPPEDQVSRNEIKRYIEYGIKGLIVLVMLVLNIHIITGYFSPPNSVELTYPLRSGVYYVGGGGGNRWINAHNAYPPQEYALDIVRLNSFGNRSFGFAPDELSDYTIYGDKIFSPCDGVVTQAVDEHPDFLPPLKDTVHVAGNYVVVECQQVQVVMAHMQEGSVVVEEGDEVTDGSLLGLVGNSGNSSQPHLHIHAKRGGDPEENILTGEGVPIRFEGRFLVRNSLFTGRF